MSVLLIRDTFINSNYNQICFVLIKEMALKIDVFGISTIKSIVMLIDFLKKPFFFNLCDKKILN